MELTTPITIFWDLPAGPVDTCSLLRVCAGIVACRPLMLQLRVGGPEIGEGTVAVLERLTGVPISVSLTIPPAALAGSAGPLLHAPVLKEILLAVERVDDLREGLDGARPLAFVGAGRGGIGASPRALGPAIGISFTVTRENWKELPALITFCGDEGMTRLVLPMQRLYDGATPFLLDGREQRELAGSLAAAGGVAGMDLTIHDPFLWRAFNPGVPFPQGGCQAANTMLAVASDGTVYPCPALPVPLGQLGEASLKEIVTSEGKKEFRRRLLENPAACRECGVIAECRGGCRGRSYVMHGSLAGTDPACESGFCSR